MKNLKLFLTLGICTALFGCGMQDKDSTIAPRQGTNFKVPASPSKEDGDAREDNDDDDFAELRSSLEDAFRSCDYSFELKDGGEISVPKNSWPRLEIESIKFNDESLVSTLDKVGFDTITKMELNSDSIVPDDDSYQFERTAESYRIYTMTLDIETDTGSKMEDPLTLAFWINNSNDRLEICPNPPNYDMLCGNGNLEAHEACDPTVRFEPDYVHYLDNERMSFSCASDCKSYAFKSRVYKISDPSRAINENNIYFNWTSLSQEYSNISCKRGTNITRITGSFNELEYISKCEEGGAGGIKCATGGVGTSSCKMGCNIYDGNNNSWYGLVCGKEF